MASSVETRLDVQIRIRNQMITTFCWVLILSSSVFPPCFRLTYALRHGLHTRGCIQPRKLLSLNTYRELFGIPDIALYASVLNHIFGL